MMREMLLYLLQNLLVMDILILAVWVLDKCFRWNSGHLWRKWLWAFVCLRMIFPIEIHLPDLHPSLKGLQIEFEVETEEISEEAQAGIADQPMEAFPGQASAEAAEGASENIKEININGVPVPGTVYSEEEHQLQTEDRVSRDRGKEADETLPELAEPQNTPAFTKTVRRNWEIALSALWFAGFFVMLFRHVFQYYFVKDFFLAQTRTCQDRKIHSLAKQWCKTYGIRKMPGLLEKENAATPMTFGYVRRRLVYPPDTYGEAEMSLILRHELVHVKYRDAWYKALILFVCDLYWFNPGFLLMKRMAFRDVEYVCDERVTRGMSSEEKKQYGETILKTLKQEPGKPVPAMVPFAVHKKDLKNRLQNLFVFQNQKKGMLLLALGLLFAAVGTAGVTVSIKEIPVRAAQSKDEHAGESLQAGDQAESRIGASVPAAGENDGAIAATCYTEDLQALNRQKDVESSYITDRFTGFNHYYIDEEGNLWGTGENTMWQLGIPKESDINNLEVQYTEPVKLAENVIHVDASVNSVFVIWLTADGKLYGLGANTWGVLRMPMVEHEALNPWLNLAKEPQLLMEEVAYASAGKHSVSVLTKDGKVWWWGLLQATTGTSDVGKMHSREPMLMLENARYTVCGFDSAAAIDGDNNLWLWGCNVWGQCGKDEPDYVTEPYLACTDVEMVWPEFLSSRQNVFDVQEWMGMNPYHGGTDGSIYNYTTFARKTDGEMYACGMDLGHDVKQVAYYGDLFVENSEYPGNYIRDYSTDFLRIEVEEHR